MTPPVRDSAFPEDENLAQVAWMTWDIDDSGAVEIQIMRWDISSDGEPPKPTVLRLTSVEHAPREIGEIIRRDGRAIGEWPEPAGGGAL